jgi:hypothetical protein
MSDLNIHIHQSGEKTAELICNWCKEPHAVEPEYREEILKRGVERIEEFRQEAEKMPDVMAKIDELGPEETWTCGRCMLFLNGLPLDAMKTDCHDHEVPEERIE